MAERVSGVKASVGFRLGDRTARTQRRFRRRGVRLRTAAAAPRRGRGDRRRHRRRQEAAGSRPRPRCAVFSTAFAICPRPWKCAAPRRACSTRSIGWIYARGPSRRRVGRHGMHLHRAGVARAHRAYAARRRHARLSAARRAAGLPDHRPCPRRTRRRTLEYPVRARSASRRKCGSITQRSRWRCMTAYLLCSDGVHGYLTPEIHRRHLARALRLRRFRPRAGRRPRSTPAAPTIARPWCSTSSICRRREPPISAPKSWHCR